MNLLSNVLTQADPLEAAQVVAHALLPGPTESVELVAGGRNSRVFRVVAAGESFALKQYPRDEEGRRDRLGAEVSALEFLGRHGVPNVPRVVAKDEAQGYAAFNWIDGNPVTHPAGADIDAMLGLAAKLNALGHANGADKIGDASAATFTGDQVVQQVECRYVKFLGAAKNTPELAEFLEHEFTPVFRTVSSWAWSGYDHKSVGFEAVRPDGSRTLSPSDFGFHNTLRQSGGGLAFIDFEYFGWDDPVKLVSDFLLHPGMNLDDRLKRRFLDGARSIYGDEDGAFEARLKALYPLYGLCWCLILLNEFLPAYGDRHQVPGGATLESIKARQLEKARAFLAKVSETYENGPDLR